VSARTRPVAAALAVLAALALPLVGALPASAAPAQTYLRLAHLSPDTPNVDVTLTSANDPSWSATVTGVGYGAVSDYRSLPAGSYTVAMRPAGAPADSPPVISTVLDAAPGAAYTVAGTGHYTALGLEVLDDELTMPPAGSARLRVVNGAATAPRVDLAVQDGPQIAQGVAFAGATDYKTVPIGRWNVVVSGAGAAPVTLPVDVATNATYTVVLLDRGGSYVAELHKDATGAGTVPVGGVDTGMGGTADAAPAPWGTVALVLGVLGAATLLVVAVPARRRDRR
jgi:hypothetical protein